MRIDGAKYFYENSRIYRMTIETDDWADNPREMCGSFGTIHMDGTFLNEKDKDLDDLINFSLDSKTIARYVADNDRLHLDYSIASGLWTLHEDTSRGRYFVSELKTLTVFWMTWTFWMTGRKSTCLKLMPIMSLSR